MNQEQAIKTFVKDKYEFLLSKNFSQQKLRQEFQNRHGTKFRRIGPKDLVVPLVRLLKERQVTTQHIKEYLETLPVFKDVGSGLLMQLRQIAYEKDFASGLTEEDLEIIKKLDAIEAAKELGAVKIGIERTKTLQEINRKIEQAQTEYDNLPSVLEYEDIPEPEFDPKYEETQQWWERFYLKSDPFRIKEGLQKIDESLYEEITVKTKPFQDMLTVLDKNPHHLFHTGFLLIGGYGYGKTTFIDYLSYTLVQKNILPVLVTPSPRNFPDSSSYANDFHLSLRDKLREQLIRISSESTTGLAGMDVVPQIKELVSRIQQHRRVGVVVFLDDYHKHESTYDYIYEFLGLQQILKNDLMRANLNVGFIVSGVPLWGEQLSRSGQLRGFLDNTPILMPEITPELVCDVFNQRISAYCFDESPRKIKPEFVKRLFKQLQLQTGYRDYLTEIITQLSNNNFAIIDAPIEIDQTILRQVKADLERDESLRGSLNKLVQSSRFKSYTKEQIEKCLGLLVQISMHEGITESDKLFIESRFYFGRLKDCALIEKQKTGPDKASPFAWVIHPRLQLAIDNIREVYKLGINDYLLKVYAGKEYPVRPMPVSQQPQELIEAHRFFGRDDLKIPRAALDNVVMALRLYEGALSRTSIKPIPEDIERGWLAFTSLSNAFFEIDGSNKFFHNAAISDLRNQWHFHWSDDEVLSELLNRYQDYASKEGSEKSITGSLVLKQLQDVFPLLVDRLMSYAQDLTDKTFHGLYSRNVQHSAEELKIFAQATEGYTSAISIDHYNYIKRITDYLEIRMRLFLFATSIMSLGEDYEKQIPASLRQYAKRNLDSRPNNSLFHNAYSGLTRAQLRTIFVDGNRIKDTICKYIQCGWTDNDWRGFFDTFVLENILTGHQQHGAFSHLDSNQYINYCRRAEELTCGINVFIRQILRNNVYLILCGDEPHDPTNYLFKFIFKPDTHGELSGKLFTYQSVPNILSNASVVESTLRGEAYKSVIGSLLNKIDGSPRNCLVEDLLDVEYLTNNYNVSYLEFVQSLAFAYWRTKRVVVQPWFGSSVLIKKAAG